MISPHRFYQIYLSFLDCTPPKCGELSECIDSAHSDTRIDQMCMTDANVGQNGQEKMTKKKWPRYLPRIKLSRKKMA